MVSGEGKGVFTGVFRLTMNETTKYMCVVNPGCEPGMAFFNCGEFEQLTRGIEHQEAHAYASDVRPTWMGLIRGAVKMAYRGLAKT